MKSLAMISAVHDLCTSLKHNGLSGADVAALVARQSPPTEPPGW